MPVNRFTWRAKSRRPSKEECGHTAHTLAAARKRTRVGNTPCHESWALPPKTTFTYLPTYGIPGRTDTQSEKFLGRRRGSFVPSTGERSQRNKTHVQRGATPPTHTLAHEGDTGNPIRHGICAVRPIRPSHACLAWESRPTGGGHVGLRAQTKKGTSKRRLFEAFNQKKLCDQSIPWS